MTENHDIDLVIKSHISLILVEPYEELRVVGGAYSKRDYTNSASFHCYG